MADSSTLATVYTGVAGVTATMLLGVLVFTEFEARRWPVSAPRKNRWHATLKVHPPARSPWLVVIWVYVYLVAVGALSVSLSFSLIGLWWEVGDVRLRPAIGWLAFGAAAFVLTHVVWLVARAVLYTSLRNVANRGLVETIQAVLLFLALIIDLAFITNQVMAQMGVPVFWYLGGP